MFYMTEMSFRLDIFWTVLPKDVLPKPNQKSVLEHFLQRYLTIFSH